MNFATGDVITGRRDLSERTGRRAGDNVPDPWTIDAVPPAATPKKWPTWNVASSAANGSAPTARTRPWGGASAVSRARSSITTEKLMTTKTISPPTTEAATAAALTRRPRRLRRTESIRSLVRETIVRPEDLIYPLFVVPNERPRVELTSMPGV